MSRPSAAIVSLLLTILLSRAPGVAVAGEPLLPAWAPIPESPVHFYGQTLAADGANHVLYLFSGSEDPGAPVQTSRVYRQDLDAPFVEWVQASSDGVPSPGNGHLFFDRSRGRLLVLGGWSFDSTTSRIWSWNPPTDAWEELVTAHPGPDTLWALQPMAHDTRRNRLLVLGSGFDTATQTWTLDLASPEPDWSLLPATNPPPFSLQSAAAYDSLADRVLVLGGQREETGYHGELWTLDLGTNQWTKHPDAVPVGSRPPKLFWDAGTDRFLAHVPTLDGFGGYANTTLFIVSLDAPPTWQPTPAGGSLDEFGAWSWTYDPVAGELHEEASDRPTPALLTLGTTPAAAWRTRHVEGRCLGGQQSAAAADVTGRAWYVHDQRTLWRIDLENPVAQEVLVPTGTAPESRTQHSAAWDSVGNRILFHGGVDSLGTPWQDTWALELGPTPHWSQLQTDVPGPVHVDRPSAIDAAQRALYLVSGSELWRLDLGVIPAAWQLFVSGLPFKIEALAFDPVSRRLLLVDGSNGYKIDVDPMPGELSPPVPQAAPTIFGAAYAYDSRRRQLIIHNGITFVSQTTTFYRNRTDVFRASTDPVFVDLGATNEASTSRAGSLATYDPVRDRMILLNGTILGLWTLQFDETTPARLDLVEARVDAAGDAIHVRFAGEGAAGEVRVERHAGGGWLDVGVADPATPGLYEFTDTDVRPGIAYRYRARWFGDGGEHVTSESAPIMLPASAPTRLALAPRGGTIVRGGPIEFSVTVNPARGPALLELVDVAGRVLARQQVEATEPAVRVVAISPARAMGAGLYFARLRQGLEVVTARLVRL